MKHLHIKGQRISFFKIMIGFAAVILVGALLLMLPFAVKEGRHASFSDALFTSTSAACVTGLIVQDTATYWSGFGQAIILILIQIGGMGVITIAALIAILSGKKIGLLQRNTIKEAVSAPTVGGSVRLAAFIVKFTLLIELLGACIMAPVFCRDYGIGKGLWMALFHSISAFCNAGFDLMGENAPFSSLTAYRTQPLINICIMLLIVIGGIGFTTWVDIRTYKKNFGRYRLQSKVILVTTFLLIVLPTIYFFIFEFSALPIGDRILTSLFQAVTPRTAGFNTVDLCGLSDAGLALMIALMLIGGSPGSTAGGMKTTTLAVLVASMVSVFRRRDSVRLGNRRLEDGTVKTAAAIFLAYLTLLFCGGVMISISEGLPLSVCFFETASAIATVGLSLGITPGLGILSRIILIMLMFLGRVGCLTLIYAAVSGVPNGVSNLPVEKITVG